MSENKKIVYVKYFIYTSENKLIDDETTWKVLIFKFEKIVGELNKTDETRFYPNTIEGIKLIKKELLQKNKIFIEDGFIRNKGCDKWLEEAKSFSEAKSNAGKKGAKARWNGTAIDLPKATNSQQPTANSQQSTRQLFEEFWNIIRYKKGKEESYKSFCKIDFDKLKFTHIELANKYNEQMDNLPEWQSPKYVQGWLTGKRWNDEQTLTPIEFQKKYNVSGKFVRYEDDFYIFQEKDSFGIITFRYNKQGKIVRDGEKKG